MSPADADVDIQIHDPRDPEADLPPHVLDKFLDQLWLAFNLAVPGALDLAEAEYTASTLDHDEPPKLDAHVLGIAYVAAIERAWPRLRPLPFGDVWEWLHRDMVYDLEVAETPVEIALVTLLQVSQRAPLDSANVVSVALALESLFGSRRDGVLRVIRPRIEAKLGRPSERAYWLSKFYDVRSRIAHGAGPIWRARRSYARGSYPKLEKYVTDVGLALSDGLGVLLAVLQDFVVTNKRQYLFTQLHTAGQPNAVMAPQSVVRAPMSRMLHPAWAQTGAASLLTLAAACTRSDSPASGGASTARGEPLPAVLAPFVSPAATRLADSLLALMTLDEKLGQLAQSPSLEGQTGPRAAGGNEGQVRAGRIGSFLGVGGVERTRALQRIAVEESRLKIPLLFAWDVIHGWRTIFPVPVAEAASFDPAGAERAARIAAVEATAAGIHWTFAPMVDIARDPRWGRIVEGSGEDPYLGSVMAAARVRGFQGADLAAPTALMATAKHFAAYGGAEGGRDYNTVEASERALWETYLPPFHAAVRAGAGSLMAAFNDIGGTPAHASDWLLRTVLRERWGFGGIVVSDWAGIEQLTAHGVAASLGDAGIRALRAGVDVDMADGVYTDSLAAAVRAGRLAESVIDTAVTRVLRTKFALGLFRDPYRGVTVERERAATLTPAHIAAARESARRAIVLLANANGTLPLPKTLRSLAVIGPLADDARSMLGNWAAIGRPEDAVTVLAGIRRAVEPGTRVLYARGAPVDTASTAGFADAVRIAREADAVILVLGEREDMSAEAASRASLELAGAQLGLAQAVVRAARASRAGASKPVVAVLVNGRPLATPWLADSVPALLETWLLGVQHGVAVADVLFGDANPGGKLPVSVPRATGQVPIYYNHRNTGRPPEAAEKYTSKYADLPWTPLYPFGHGLSYTTFAYRDLHLSSPTMRATDSLRVSVTVTNSGRRAGDEVVQLYLRDDVASVARPVKELRRFERITLEPGESRTVRWTLGPDDLAFYDGALRRIVEPGTFTLYAGTSSADESHLARFTVTGDTLVLAAPPPRFR